MMWAFAPVLAAHTSGNNPPRRPSVSSAAGCAARNRQPGCPWCRRRRRATRPRMVHVVLAVPSAGAPRPQQRLQGDLVCFCGAFGDTPRAEKALQR
eukprot:359372-Chlamydomonas_euryale.AAC.1